MARVDLTLPHHDYAIRIEPGLLGRLGEVVSHVVPAKRAALIVDKEIEKSHGRSAARSLTAAGFDTHVLVFPGGEPAKTLATYGQLCGALIEAGIDRQTPVVALGGGITGDVAGFVAATTLRGMPFVQVPTTLLAMVDASVGGKTGVNTKQGKNLVGAFHQPAVVLADVESLRTLPDRELRCGLAECVKHGMIRDASLLTWIGDNLASIRALQPQVMTELVEKNVRIKAAVVMADEREAGERAHLNLGHTFAHAIEAANARTKLLHGEAVAIGMVAATWLAVELGRCRRDALDNLVALLEAIGLPTGHPRLESTDILMHFMKRDKKVQGDRLRLILPEAAGRVTIADDVPASAVAAAWDARRG